MTKLHNILGFHITHEQPPDNHQFIVWRKSGETVIVWNGVERRCNVYDMVIEFRDGKKVILQ